MIANFFIKRPIAAIVVALLIVLMGSISIYLLPAALNPKVSPPNISITGSYLGANSTTVEETVLIPIENALSGIANVMYIKANATSYGFFNLNIVLETGSNIEKALVEIQTRLREAESILPDEVKKSGIVIREAAELLFKNIMLTSPKGTHDWVFMSNYLRLFIQPEIAKIKGVGQARLDGAPAFAMRIWLDPIKMTQLKISPEQVLSAVNKQNKQIAAGVIGRPPVKEGIAFEYTISVDSRLKTVEDFENIIVFTHAQTKAFVFLKDIAQIELGQDTYEGHRQLDGRVVAALEILPTSDANALELARAIEDKLKELSANFPEDLVDITAWDSSLFVKDALIEVVKVFFDALLLVILVVFFFLQSYRATLIALLAIPVSIIGTFPFFIWLDFTINSITLFGMILAIGIVVDDAIIVVEAVQHYIDKDKISAKAATYKAMKEISGPVIATAFILAAVFVPVAFIPGLTGGLFKQFAVTIAISVILSAFVALSLIPALCVLMMNQNPIQPHSKGLYGFFFRFNNWLDRKTRWYGRVVEKSLIHLKWTLLLLLFLSGMTIYLIKIVPQTFLPKEDLGFVLIPINMLPNTASAKTLEKLEQMQKLLQNNPNVKHILTISHFDFMSGGVNSPNAGALAVIFKDFQTRHKFGKVGTELYQELNDQLLKANLSDLDFLMLAFPPIDGLGSTDGFSVVVKQIQGSLEELDQVKKDLIQKLEQRQEIDFAFSSFTAEIPNILLKINREKAMQLGVDIKDIDQAFQVFLGGFYINDINLYNQNFRVYVQAQSNYREKIEQLFAFHVPNASGQMIPLGSLVEYQYSASAQVISHFNQKRAIEITGDAAQGYGSKAALEAIEQVFKEHLPANYTYEFSNLSLQEIRSGHTSMLILLLSLLVVFLFLAAFYESWSVPFAVLSCIPVGIFGAFVALYLSGSENSIYAQIGLVTLVGLSVKTSILIVEFCKEKQEQGMNLFEAVITAATLRLRPILMTGLAFVFGVVALITASGAGAEPKNNLGWTVFGGMIAIVFISIFFVPALYVGVVNLREKYFKSK